MGVEKAKHTGLFLKKFGVSNKFIQMQNESISWTVNLCFISSTSTLRGGGT